MNKKFVSDYYFKDDIWKIFMIDKDESINYFNMSNKNNIDEKELNLPRVTGISNNCMNKMLYSMMNEHCIEFLNVYDNKFYEVYKCIFNYRDCPVILNYCNEKEPFIVVQTSVYMDFMYIFYINKKEVIKITYSPRDQLYYFDDILNSIYWVNNNNINTYVKNFKRYIFFGFNFNVGHHLWNEVSGLYYFLENKNYHDKIDGIIIGPYDAFNIESVLKKKYNFNILKFTDIFEVCHHFNFKNLTNIFPIFLNSCYIDKNVKNLLDDVNDNINSTTNDDDNINSTTNDDDNINSTTNDHDNILEISIDIRTYRRQLINQDIFYTKLIKKIIDDYNKYIIKINFIGVFQTNCNSIEIIIPDCNTKKEYIEQKKIVENIIQNFNENKNIIFKNLIGEHFFNIKNETINSKLFIGVFGTCSSNLLAWIYDVKQIIFGPREAYMWKHISHDTLQKYNIIMSPKEYILTDNGIQEPFDIDFDLFYSFFVKELNNILLTVPN
jgi:hypothetical protein